MLALSGIPIPTDLDGSPLRPAFTPSLQKNIRFVDPSAAASQGGAAPSLAAEEITAIESRLRDLGYLG